MMNRVIIFPCLLLLVCLLFACMTPKRDRMSDVYVMDGVMHLTNEGETLYAIANTYNVSPQLLQRVNQIKNAEATLKPNSRIFIPGASELKYVNIEKKEEIKPDGLYHLVEPGQTLYAIANAYDISPQKIKEANNLSNSMDIQAWQKLWIPHAKEVKDVEVPKVTVITEKPIKEITKEEPRVKAKEVPPPKPEKEAKEKEKEAPKKVEFPREVTTIGPEKFQWPLKDAFRVLRPFSTSSNNYNPGVDLGSEIGTPVYASADGEAVIVDLDSSFGNYIVLYHGERNDLGIYTIYSYNKENLIQLGQKVERGEKIATVGNTGRPPIQNQGILHFQMRERDKALDPTKYLPPLN